MYHLIGRKAAACLLALGLTAGSAVTARSLSTTSGADATILSV